ncbi:MAG: thioredoxin domain-containing protein [Bacteroidota bacterium]
MSHNTPNKLINETSPYLLQHAYNPVQWYAWGDEALQKAKALNKPILVSIGYSACHWCHVMERESFENVEVANIMNEHFINIKIDREERPDLDAIYMDAVQAIAGSGGWPLNVFLTPETKPFYGGTYFPPVQAFNRSSWTEVLYGVATAWKERKHEIESQAENLMDYLNKSNGLGNVQNILPTEERIFTPESCHIIFKNILANADKKWGGFGKAPKFPQTFTIQYLLEYYHFTKNKEALEQAILSIDKMLEGGIFDHIAGGLARYSTDVEWLAPHFEKMLYDNALLINILCDAYQITKNDKYEKAIRKTIGFVKDELGHHQGGFYAALDADSEGEEGKYYVWSKNEIDEILKDDALLFSSFYDVTENGNWEHKNILRILKPIEQFITEHGLSRDEFETKMETCLEKLLKERNKRVKPGLDDKIILSWNALMLHAICKAASALQDNSYTTLAETTYDFILSNFKNQKDDKELYHTFKNDVAKYPAFLEDYAYFIQSCVSLYQITFNNKYLDTAKIYMNYVVEHFSDENDLFFYFTHREQTDIIVRKKEIYDGAMPSGNAIMAKNLLLLSVINEHTKWQQRAEQMLFHLKDMGIKYPTSFGNWVSLILNQTMGTNEIKITSVNPLNAIKAVHSVYIPNKILLANDKESTVNGNLTLFYICKNNVCLPPLKTVEEVIKYVENASILS